MAVTQDECYTTSGKYCACIEVHLTEHKRRGFHTSQLIEYTLEPNPDAEDDKNAPPQKLVISFSTADVVILGWRLERLCEKIRENDLATVSILPKRYGELERYKAFVGSIKVTPIAKQ
jgi:hypothetical protein